MPRSKSTKSRARSRSRPRRTKKYTYKGYYDGPVKTTMRASPKRASPRVPSTPARRPQFVPGTTPRTTQVKFGNEIGVTPSRLQFDFQSPSK